RLVAALREGRRVRTPVDQYGTPTYAPNLAEALVELVQRRQTGIWNVSGTSCVNRVEFAVAAARAFGLDPALIEAVPTAALGQPAPRPFQAGLRVDRATAFLRTRLLDHVEGLRAMREDQR